MIHQGVTYLELDQLDPSPWQTRSFPRKDPELGELATSIQELGVLQPVLVRPVGVRFQILAGERRVRAARLAELDVVPVIVRKIDDDTAAQICVVENLQREDLGVIEEGHAVALLLERDGWTFETVAAQIGRTSTWVARRSSLWTRLSEGWKKIATTPGHPAYSWPAARLEVVATLDTADQDEILKRNKASANWFWTDASASELQRHVDTRLRRLSAAPFRHADAKLVPEAGKCTECPFRASQEHLLFDNVKPGKGIPKGDRCLRPACWDQKAIVHLRAAVEMSEAKYGKKPILAVGYQKAPYQGKLGKGLERFNI